MFAQSTVSLRDLFRTHVPATFIGTILLYVGPMFWNSDDAMRWKAPFLGACVLTGIALLIATFSQGVVARFQAFTFVRTAFCLLAVCAMLIPIPLLWSFGGALFFSGCALVTRNLEEVEPEYSWWKRYFFTVPIPFALVCLVFVFVELFPRHGDPAGVAYLFPFIPLVIFFPYREELKEAPAVRTEQAPG